jgi:hypothetical protein
MERHHVGLGEKPFRVALRAQLGAQADDFRIALGAGN